LYQSTLTSLGAAILDKALLRFWRELLAIGFWLLAFSFWLEHTSHSMRASQEPKPLSNSSSTP
jgi:hypothetical protein